MKYRVMLGILVCVTALAEVKIVPPPKELRDAGRECRLNAGGAVIVVGAKAGETEQAAAERLQTLILRRFKVQLEIVNEADDTIDKKQQILLGLPATHSRLAALLNSQKLSFSSDKLAPEGYLLEMVPTPLGDTVVIAGGGPRGVLYGQDTFFDLLEQRGAEIIFPAVSVRDWPTIPWRGWPHFVLEHLLEPGGFETCVRARLNFTDARDNPNSKGSLVGKPRAALMGCPAGVPIDKEPMGQHISNAHRYGFFVYGTVACAVSPERYDQVLATYRELLALGVDGLWISFDDSGSGASPCAIIQQVLALGAEHDISGRAIAITPPLKEYKKIDMPLNRAMAAVPGMAEATWFFTRVPCAADRAMARDIGLTRPSAWWHNLVSVGSGFTHSGQIFAPLRKGNLPGYLELQPLSSGWGRPSYDSIRTAADHTDTVMLWGLSWGYPFEYELTALGYWAWNPEQHDWQDTRAAIYRHVYGPSCVADACFFDDQMGVVKGYFDLPRSRHYYKSPLWPWRLKSPGNRDQVFKILDAMDAACMRLTRSARRESALDAARLERYYLEPMSASLRFARAMAQVNYPEYTLPRLESEMLDLLEAGKTEAATETLRAVQEDLLPEVEKIRVKLDGLKVLDPYVKKWEARLSGLDYWQNFRKQRLVDMRNLFNRQMKRPARELLKDRTENVSEEDMRALFNAYSKRPAGGVLAAFEADAWLETPPLWRGQWGAGLYTNGLSQTVALVFPDRTVSTPGEFVEISALIEVPQFNGRLLLDLFVQDSRQTNKGQGYRLLQLYANQSKVWSEDIVMDRTGHEWVTVDITDAVKPGERLRLRFRVEDRQPVGNLTVAFAGPFQLRSE